MRAVLLPMLVACMLAACAGRAVQTAPTSAPRLDAREFERVRALAPDFLGRAERAFDAARNAKSSGERADHERRASLLLEAAKTEAVRVELARETAKIEAQALALDEANLAAEREQLALVAQLNEAKAAAQARAELDAALTRAKSPGARGRDVQAQATARRHAAQVLLDRARLTRAAAIALTIEERTLASVTQAIDAAQAQLSAGRDASPQAVRALEVAERALGDAQKKP